ncbi:PilN domain-containing protein [Gemmatimonadota bacterium]
MVFEINLLPEKYRKKKLAIKVDARLLGGGGGVIVVALIVMTTINQGKTFTELEARHGELEAQKAIVEQMANRVRGQKDEVRNINNRIATLEGLGGRNSIQLQLLEIVSSRLPENVWLLDINQTLVPDQRGGGLTVTADRVLNFRGVALLKEGVTAWISRLQDEELIQEVQTNYLRPIRVEGADIFEFSLTTSLNISG